MIKYLGNVAHAHYSGLLLEMFGWWWQVSESPSELRVVGRGEAGDGLLQGDGAQHDGELHHEVEGGAGGVDMEVQPVI